jgi:hypothetical protein
LTFHEYLVEETIEVAALYGPGVLVRVPTPTRYALHKLLVAQERGRTELAKRQKDLRQARELMDILIDTDEASFQDSLDEARERGRSWKSAIHSSLKEIGRDARQGRLPLPVKPAAARTPVKSKSRKGK